MLQDKLDRIFSEVNAKFVKFPKMVKDRLLCSSSQSAEEIVANLGYEFYQVGIEASVGREANKIFVRFDRIG